MKRETYCVVRVAFQRGPVAIVGVTVRVDSGLLEELDRLVAQGVFANRSSAVQGALEDKLARIRRTRLANECAQLDRRGERAMAEEGMAGELEAWPEY